MTSPEDSSDLSERSIEEDNHPASDTLATDRLSHELRQGEVGHHSSSGSNLETSSEQLRTRTLSCESSAGVSQIGGPPVGQQAEADHPMGGQQAGASHPMGGQQAKADHPMFGQQPEAGDPMGGQQAEADHPMFGQQPEAGDPMGGQQVEADRPMDGQQAGADHLTSGKSAGVDNSTGGQQGAERQTVELGLLPLGATFTDLELGEYLEGLLKMVDDASHQHNVTRAQLYDKINLAKYLVIDARSCDKGIIILQHKLIMI